jgi:hypothetical protein
MAARRLLREVLICSLIAVFAADVTAQSLGDVAREQKLKKAAAQSDEGNRKVFSNIDNPPTQAITSSGKGTRNRTQRSESPLQIVAPADGEVFSPGDTVKVRVTSLTNRDWEVVSILAAISGVPPTEVVHSLPAEFSITIPSNITACRRYSLTAMGRTTAGEVVDSDSIAIDVERPDMPVSLSSQSSSLIMEAPGENLRLLILAHFSDGAVIEMSESGKLTFHSTDTKIVTVDETRTAMAVATGKAAVIVTYKNQNGPDLQLTIPVAVERFQVTFLPSSLDFGNVQVGSSASLPVTVTNNTFSNMLLMIKAIITSGPYSEKDSCKSSLPLAVGAKCEIKVTFTPTEPGQNPGKLNIVDSASGVASVIVMSGNGVK